MRQLYMYCAMFANEHKTGLPYTTPLYDTAATMSSKKIDVSCWAHTGYPGGKIDWNVESGLLRYINGQGTREAILICPQDNEASFHGILVPRDQRNFSYSFNEAL